MLAVKARVETRAKLVFRITGSPGVWGAAGLILRAAHRVPATWLLGTAPKMSGIFRVSFFVPGRVT
jgi:hypothetical protein